MSNDDYLIVYFKIGDAKEKLPSRCLIQAHLKVSYKLWNVLEIVFKFM